MLEWSDSPRFPGPHPSHVLGGGLNPLGRALSGSDTKSFPGGPQQPLPCHLPLTAAPQWLFWREPWSGCRVGMRFFLATLVPTQGSFELGRVCGKGQECTSGHRRQCGQLQRVAESLSTMPWPAPVWVGLRVDSGAGMGAD